MAPRTLVFVAFLMTTAACAAAPDLSMPLEPVPTIDPATADALRFRTEFGLRADLEFIAAVAADPTATDELGVPLLPAEIREIERRSADSERIVPIVRAYVAGLEAEFGGLYVDQAARGRVIVLFTDHLDEHEAALQERLAGVGIVVVRRVRYSEADLRALQERIVADSAWFETIPAVLSGVGVDTIANAVSIHVSSANPAAAVMVQARLGVDPSMISVLSDGSGAAFFPVATIRGRVVFAGVAPPGANGYEVAPLPREPGSCGGDIDGVAHGVGPDGRFEIPCHPGTWTVVISDLRGVELGRGDVVVPAIGGVVEMTITLDPPPG